MDYEKTLEELKHMKVETGSFVCLGCGHEHNCSIHGCAILRDAVECIEKLKRVLQESEAARAELGKRLAAAQKMNAELTDAQAVMVKEFEAKLEELEQVKAERDEAYRQLGGEPPKTCKTCDLWGKDGWSQHEIGYCEGDDNPHGPDDFCSRHCKKKEGA